jgi:hypothetical protein
MYAVLLDPRSFDRQRVQALKRLNSKVIGTYTTGYYGFFS